MKLMVRCLIEFHSEGQLSLSIFFSVLGQFLPKLATSTTLTRCFEVTHAHALSQVARLHIGGQKSLATTHSCNKPALGSSLTGSTVCSSSGLWTGAPGHEGPLLGRG